ncbi:hypothetical protein MKX03_012422 [Papaver bracteatum]|nr:hypothetical protein MKX03_012422 [Papaver bracteatum]
MAQMREQAVLDENGKQQSTIGEIYVNALPTPGDKLSLRSIRRKYCGKLRALSLI